MVGLVVLAADNAQYWPNARKIAVGAECQFVSKEQKAIPSRSHVNRRYRNFLRISDRDMFLGSDGSIQVSEERMRQKWTEQDVQFIVDSYQTMGAQEQADRLGRTLQSVYLMRTKLIQADRLVAHQRRMFRPWTPDEDTRLIALVERGVPVAVSAKQLRRTECAVRKRMATVLGGIDPHRNNSKTPVRSLSQVAQLFGVSRRIVVEWVVSGVLSCTRSHYGRMRQEGWPQGDQVMGRYLVSTADLLAFIRDRSMWIWWSPETLDDLYLRRMAEQARTLAGGHWMTTEDIAAELRYAVTTVRDWLRCGLLPHKRRGRIFYVWSGDFADFVPPKEAPRTPESVGISQTKTGT